MPAIITVDIGVGKLKCWNLNVKVGVGGSLRGMDVSLAQWLLVVARKSTDPGLTAEDVVGVWGPKSRAALALIETKHRELMSSDGCLDPVRPGQTSGSISHKLYKMLILQMEYLRIVTGFSALLPAVLAVQITIQEMEKLLMSMPENSSNMPQDLKLAMIAARDGGTLEF